jgi:hypothetical protein
MRRYWVLVDGRMIGTVVSLTEDDAVLAAAEKFRLSLDFAVIQVVRVAGDHPVSVEYAPLAGGRYAPSAPMFSDE